MATMIARRPLLVGVGPPPFPARMVKRMFVVPDPSLGISSQSVAP